MSQAEAEWWYIHGFIGDLAFSHAAFTWRGAWRVHATTYNFKTKERKVVTENSQTGYSSSLLRIKELMVRPDGGHEIPRALGRKYWVDPFAEAVIQFGLNPEDVPVSVWHEFEKGPIMLEDGWRWTAIRRGDKAWLRYFSGDVELCLEFRRSGWKGNVTSLPDVLIQDACRDHFVSDSEFGFRYEEYPIRGDGYEGFIEFVPPGSLQKIPPPVDVKLKEYALGEPNATALLLALYQASQLADDIADCDERPDRIADVMRVLGVEMPRNPFFRAHADVLTATLAQVIDCWEWSNKHEDDKDQTNRVLAYSMKDAAIMYVRQVAFLVGGHEHAKRVLDDAIQFFHGPGGVEPFEVTR